MKLLNFNIIRLTICLIIGILIGFYIELSLSFTLVVNLVLIFSLSITYLIKGKATQNYVFGALALLIFISLGVTSTKVYDDRNKTAHYLNSEIAFKTHADFSFIITKRLKPDTYNNKYFAEITSINASKVFGKILLNVQKDSLFEHLKIGSVYLANTTLSEVTKPKNPFQFDYNSYLKKRNIHHQLYLKHNEFIHLKTDTHTLDNYADSFRAKVNEQLVAAGFKDDVLSIINALLLGQRQDISAEVYNNYVNAGTIHILAVSGLHVGIIFIILSHFLKPLHRLKHGKHLIKPIIIIIILWCFAFIAGLSPSVTRAVTMFSIITCAQFLRRPTNIYNTLTISAFVMLLFKPIYLFDVGFQMSYLAVLAIVSIQPILYGFWKPSNKVTDYFWKILTVTIAAQIGVAPIGLFYFHQFPGLFFISNLVIIPALGLILGLGILVITLALLNILPNVLAQIFSFIIDCLNEFIAWIAQFEDFLLRGISFSIYHVFGSYIIIISLLYLWKHKSITSLKYSLLSILLFSGMLVFNKYQNAGDELIIFNKNRTTLIGEKHNSHLNINHNIDSFTVANDKTLKNYNIGHFIETTEISTLKSTYSYKNELLLVIDSVGIYNSKLFKPSYILLSDSPKINLNRLIDSLKPKHIIADASNYKSYVKRWQQTCKHKKIPFHSTYEKGAFILK